MARSLILAAALALVAAACAEDPTLDHESLVAGLPAAVVPDDPEVVVDVVCPEADDAPVARSLTCTAAIHGESITIDLEVDDEGAVAAVALEPLLDLHEVEDALVARLADDLDVGAGSQVAVTCPGTVVVNRAGVEVRCVGSSGGRDRELIITVGDDSGWTVAFAPPTG